MRVLLFSLLLLIGFGCKNASTETRSLPPSAQLPQKSEAQKNANVPKYVLDVLSFVRDNGAAPDGFVGGRTFQNREKRLQLRRSDGQKINYREWDVHPKKQGQNRGAERLITGDDGSAWFTADHYRTFVKVE